MKKKTIYIVSAIILISLVVGFIVVNSEYFLFRAKNYKVYNEKGERLPILLFDRANNHEYAEEDSPVVKEIILYIEDEINMISQTYNHEVLTIHIDDPYLLEAVGGRESFLKINNFILFQTRANTGDDFWPLYNNRIAYESMKDEPIQFFIAEDNTYKFNTFGGLKAYGDTIIVKKLDGPIEKEGKYIAGE